ncbi:MAG TPA: restriction endonuclease [Casimicrobiaceae bacterium]|nr:restriction endonuclease [Casimicrobiaceae bacterium]
MKLKMAENSLFAILLRSPWWISGAIALGVALVAIAALPETWKLFGAFTSAPFIVIACIAGYRQFRAPSPARVASTLDEVRAMSWREFANRVEAALRNEGYDVRRIERADVDFEARKDARLTLVSSKRFKVARTGVKPLQDLHAAMGAREADDALYVVAGEVTDQARDFAARHRIRVVNGPALAAWFRSRPRDRLRAA